MGDFDKIKDEVKNFEHRHYKEEIEFLKNGYTEEE